MLYPLAVLPLGLGLLIGYWFPHHWLRLTGWVCSLHMAAYVIVKVDEVTNTLRVILLPLTGP